MTTTLTAPRGRSQRLCGFTLKELTRQITMLESTFFIVALPVALYFMFDSLNSQGDIPIGSGNLGGFLMLSMATYGAVTATSSITGHSALERQQGWGRQLALTALRPVDYLIGKVLVGLGMAVLPIACVFAAGAITGAELGSPGRWVLCGLLCLLTGIPFALFGLAVALAFRSEAVLSVSSGILVVLSFLGNLFMPLSGTLLDFARFTPLYGTATLIRWPLMEAGSHPDDSLTTAVLSLVAWTLIFAAACVLLNRRRTAR